jgi:hypothetical protein
MKISDHAPVYANIIYKSVWKFIFM